MNFKTSLLSLFLTLLIMMPVLAQSPSALSPSKEEQEKAQKELERKALALLDNTLEGAQLLKLAENRALVQLTAGDLLWPRDEKRARSLFRDSMMLLGDTMNNLSSSAARDNTLWMLVNMRRMGLQMIARRDPQLALDLLHNTRPPDGDSRLSFLGGKEQELYLEQSIASQVAESDPKRALQMAEENLSKGVSFVLIQILYKLQQKDAEAATKLAGDIIKKLQTEDFTKNMQAVMVAQSLLQYVLQQGGSKQGDATASSSTKIKPLALEDQSIHDLADLIVNAILSGPISDQGWLMSMQSILPELQKRVPERAAQLQKRFSEFNKTMNPQMKAWRDSEQLMLNGSPDAIMEAAAKAPAEMRAQLYMAAAGRLFEAGDVERARQVVADNLSGPEREHMLVELDRQLMSRSLEKGKIEEARQLAQSLKSKDARAMELSFLATSVAAKGDHKMALQLMSEALNLVDRQPDNQQELMALLQIVRAYAVIEPARAFDLMEPLIDQANRMLSAAALLEKFGAGTGPEGKLFKKGEMLLQPGFTVLDMMNAQFGKDLAALARFDFEHTKALSDRFERNEARLMARLFIARSILSDHSEQSIETVGGGIFFGGRRGAVLIGTPSY